MIPPVKSCRVSETIYPLNTTVANSLELYSQRLCTPILFIVFCSLDTTQQTFSAIKKVKPMKLYVSCDGHRPEKTGEKEKVNAVREYILQNIDWECEVKTNFLAHNLGTKYALYGAIKWFFDNEEHGIILEHDCLPNISFFRFCEENLERYKHHDRVMLISGMSFFDNLSINESYFFGKYAHGWGWASWKRVIDLYYLEDPDFENNFLKISDRFHTKQERTHWYNEFNNYYKGNVQTWDYPLLFCVWKNNGICIYPKLSMVKQIGFGHIDSVHTKFKDKRISNMKIFEIDEIVHPLEVAINKNLDLLAFKKGNFIPMNLFRRLHETLAQLFGLIIAYLKQSKTHI